MTAPQLTPPLPSGIDSLDRWLNLLWRKLTASGEFLWGQIDTTGTADFDGNITVAGNATVAGNTTLGDSSSDSTTINGNVSISGIITGGQSSVSVNTSLTDTTRSVLVTATGKTITLPAASTARIGGTWTVMLGIAGYVDITRSGSDTLNLPTTETTIRLRNKGASVSLRCTSATSWSIV